MTASSAAQADIQRASGIIVGRLEADAHRALETVLIVGEQLSRISEAVEDPACGYEGATRDKRFSAAIKQEILSRTCMSDLTSKTLWRWRTIYEAFGGQRERVIEANVPQNKLLEFAKTRDPAAALGAFLLAPPKEDAPKKRGRPPKADAPTSQSESGQPASSPPQPERVQPEAPPERSGQYVEVAMQIVADVSAGMPRPTSREEVAKRYGREDAPLTVATARVAMTYADGYLASHPVEELRTLITKAVYDRLAKGVEDKIRFAELYHPSNHMGRFPFTQAEYRSVLFCLHPDQRDSRTREDFDAAFRLFKARENRLMLPDKLVGKAPPRESYDEFLESLKAKGKKAKKENAA